MRYAVRDREAGNVIEYVDTMEEGLKLVEQYEADDKEDGTYEPDFYEVVEAPEKWYAVQETSEDAWDHGSFNFADAVKMLREQGHGLIAVIDDNFCIKEIKYEEI